MLQPASIRGAPTPDVGSSMLQAALVKAKGDVFLQLGRPGDGADIAAAVTSDRVASGEQDGAAAQALRRLQTLEAD